MTATVCRLGKGVAEADPDAVIDALRRASTNYWPYGRWLDTNSPKDMVAELRSGGCPDASHVSEYVAVSALHHCYDGWSYLSQALVAEASANFAVARHLSYYAELRAAMSLLAVHGIAVMDSRPAIVTRTGACNTALPRIGTHEFAWKALSLLCRHTNYRVFLDVIQPGRNTLTDWTAPLLHGIAASVTDRWMNDWSRNFYRDPDDRWSRNRASYNPTALLTEGPRPARQVADMLIAMWRLVEPHGADGFAVLDRSLLRQALGQLLDESSGDQPGLTLISAVHEAANPRTEAIRRMTEGLVLSESQHRYWYDALMAKDQDTDDFVAQASKKAYESHQLLARALLLLRLATGSVAKLLSGSVADARQGLAFWLNDLQVRRQLWPGNEPPEEFSDLWDDVDDSIEEIDDWRHRGGCYYEMWRDHGDAVTTLATTERIFLWGLGL